MGFVKPVIEFVLHASEENAEFGQGQPRDAWLSVTIEIQVVT
jgi:hypothetical protein